MVKSEFTLKSVDLRVDQSLPQTVLADSSAAGAVKMYTGQNVTIIEPKDSCCPSCNILSTHHSEFAKKQQEEWNILHNGEKRIKSEKRFQITSEITKKFREARQDFLDNIVGKIFGSDSSTQTKQSNPNIIVKDGHNNRFNFDDTVVITERTKDKHVEEAASTALGHIENVLNFYLRVHNHNSVTGHGEDVKAVIHYDKNLDNAFWDGLRMVFGDGDGKIWDAFWKFLDVVGHEITHGVTGARLVYNGDAGALNEHISDVFGLLIKHYTSTMTVDEAVGKHGWQMSYGLLRDAQGKEYALRDFENVGTAYPEDPQKPNYQDRYKGSQDNGGVHINSGVANHAFYLFAMSKPLGERALEATKVGIYNDQWDFETKKGGYYSYSVPGTLWFNTLMSGKVKKDSTMPEFAKALHDMAGIMYPGDKQEVQEKLNKAWLAVGIDASRGIEARGQI